MISSNLHTHTVYCDGSGTCEEIVRRALSLGFVSVGFSGHAFTPFDESYCMSRENTKKYFRDISLLKEKYGEQIDIFSGLEYDLYSECDTSLCDFLIGSVHYIKLGGEYFPVDESAELAVRIINTHFSGSSLEYFKAYYETVSSLRDIKCDIIGHFDLVSKFSEACAELHTDTRKYKALALGALHTLSETKKLFELNTGAISRGYRTTPYPEPFLLKEMHSLGCEIIVSSDCHDPQNLNCGFKEAEALLRFCGFNSVQIKTKTGFIGVRI